MKSQTANFIPQIVVTKPVKNNPIIDIGITKLQSLKNADSLALTMMFYPRAREVSSENFYLLPYQEYIDEITSGHRTTYELIHDFSDKFFGLAVSLIIFIAFGLWQKDQLLTVEAVAAVIGSYVIGKEMWSDIDDWLQKISKNWFISWKDRDYYYQKLDFGSIQNYTRYIRNIRYGQDFVLPSNLDYVNQSTSKILELKFNQKELDLMSKDKAHLVSLEYEKIAEKTFVSGEYMLAVKLSLIKTIAGVQLIDEYFQSKDSGVIGCVDDNKKWLKDKVMLRKSIKIGNLKIYLQSKIFDGLLFD